MLLKFDYLVRDNLKYGLDLFSKLKVTSGSTCLVNKCFSKHSLDLHICRKMTYNAMAHGHGPSLAWAGVSLKTKKNWHEQILIIRPVEVYSMNRYHTCRLRFITLYNLIIYSVRYCKHVFGSSTKKYLFESNLIWWWGSQALMNFGIVVKQRNIVSCLTLQTVPHFEIKLASSPLRRRISAANVKQRQHTQNRLAGNLVCLSTA